MLGYLYSEIHKAHQKQGLTSVDKTLVEQVLKEIAEGKGPISTLSALGIGSDLDLLIDFPEGSNGEQKTALTDQVNAFINSASKGLESSPLRNSIAPQGDVNEYHTQINETVRQGGSSLDWLAFPIANDLTNDFRMPEKHPDILQKFFKGEADFVEAEKSEKLTTEAKDQKNTVRGLRPLLEIPFLQLTAGGQRTLQGRIKQILEATTLDDRARTQFAKMVRNQRFQAANRFAAPDVKEGTFEADVRALSKKYKENGMPLIPEFTTHSPLATRRAGYDPGGLQASGLLMTTDDFIAQHTDEGKLYHGTPKVEYMLAMIRGGMVASSSEQGTAAYGKGTYTTPSRELASNDYAGGEGFVLELPVKREGLRVLNLDSLKKSKPSELARLESLAKAKGMDFHDYLARECGVDIIVHTHVILQNVDAVNIPQNVQEMANAMTSNLKARLSSLKDKEQLQDFLKNQLPTFKKYRSFFTDLGLTGLPTDDDIATWLKEAITKVCEDSTAKLIHEQTKDTLLIYVNSLKMLSYAKDHLRDANEISKGFQEKVKGVLSNWLSSSKEEEQLYIVELLLPIQKDNPSFISAFKKVLSDIYEKDNLILRKQAYVLASQFSPPIQLVREFEDSSSLSAVADFLSAYKELYEAFRWGNENLTLCYNKLKDRMTSTVQENMKRLGWEPTYEQLKSSVEKLVVPEDTDRYSPSMFKFERGVGDAVRYNPFSKVQNDLSLYSKLKEKMREINQLNPESLKKLQEYFERAKSDPNISRILTYVSANYDPKTNMEILKTVENYEKGKYCPEDRSTSGTSTHLTIDRNGFLILGTNQSPDSLEKVLPTIESILSADYLNIFECLDLLNQFTDTYRSLTHTYDWKKGKQVLTNPLPLELETKYKKTVELFLKHIVKKSDDPNFVRWATFRGDHGDSRHRSRELSLHIDKLKPLYEAAIEFKNVELQTKLEECTPELKPKWWPW